MMTSQEINRVKAICKELGVSAAAKKLGVHKTSLFRLLAGDSVRPNTETVIRQALTR